MKSAANRENAKFSIGPKTKIGKLRASGNSAKHSLFARKLFLDDEEERLRFEEFRSAIYRQLSPSTMLQQIKCEHVVTSAWNLESAYQYEMGRWKTLRKEEVAKDVHSQSAGEKYFLSQWYLAGNADLQNATRFLVDLRKDVQENGWIHSKNWEGPIVKTFGRRILTCQQNGLPPTQTILAWPRCSRKSISSTAWKYREWILIHCRLPIRPLVGRWRLS